MQKRIWLVVIVALLAAALGTTAPVRGAGGDNAGKIAPQVIDTAPARGEELPIDGAVTFYFDQPMDHASVGQAFKVTPGATTLPAVTGSQTWPDDQTLVFKPAGPLMRSAEYAFTVGGDAKSKTGVPLRDTFTLKLRTPNALQVSQILPASSAKNIEATPTITVIFNRPVVPLLPVEQMAQLPSPITMSPEVAGKGEWLSTSIYTFKPLSLPGGMSFTITVHKGLKDISGSELANDVTSTFSTVGPRVIEIQPADSTNNVARDGTMTVTFSQPMDKDATGKAITLQAINDPKAAKANVPGTVKWSDDSLKATFTPSTLFNYTANYQLTVDRKVARSASGGLLQDDATARFTIIDLPDIISTEPQDGKQDVQPYGGFTFSFSAPMKLDNFKARVTIDPKPELLYDDDIDPDGFYFTYGFGTEPSTSYTVTLDTTGLVDKYGTPLKLDPKNNVYTIIGANKAQIKYTTAAYPAEASLKTSSYIGLYSAYRPQTRVFTTHRNISLLDMSLYSIPVMDLLKITSSAGYEFQQNYQPQDFLRRWQVPVANPANVLRYDLLNISDKGPNLGQISNVSCPGAPSSRLNIGDHIIVLNDDPRPLRLRDKAGLTGSKIIAQAKSGVALTVTGGPICSDKFVWWQVVSADNTISGWAAEGDQLHYYMGPKPGAKPAPTSTAANQPSDTQATALKPGVYFLRFGSPEMPDEYSQIEHWMIVATANITLKVTPHELIAWVTDLQTGKPLSGVDVTFYTGVLQVKRGVVKTDANGLARMPLTETLDSLYHDVGAVLDDGKNFGIGVGNWADGIDPSDFSVQSDFYPQTVNVYLYTDRALYRPGQPVYFRGVLRSRDDVTYSLSNLKSVLVRITDNEGKRLYDKELPLTPFGTFSDNLGLDANAPLGYYCINAYPGLKAGDEPKESQPTFSQCFNVAEYRLPEFQVHATADHDQVVQGDKISVTVDSTYFFGGAVSNADVSWNVTSAPYYFNYTGADYYSFMDYNEDAGPSANDQSNFGSNIAEGKGKTDAQGKFTIQVPADLGKTPVSQTFTIEANITDESGLAVAGRANVTVNQGLFYIGVKPEEYIGVAKESQKIDLLSTDWNSKPVAGTDLSIRVVERVWSSVQTIEPGTGRTVWNYDVKENPVTDGVVHTDQDGKAVYEFTPSHGGIYKVYATSRDSKGNQITSSAFDWVAGPDYVPWRQQNSNRIDLKIDRDKYQVGDTASILIASPFQGEATALVTVERGHIIKTEVVTMTTNSMVYKLPITLDMAPDAFVSVMIVKGVDAKNPVAAFRMGLVQLNIETDRLNLKIDVTPDKPQAGPREKVSYKLHVTDYAGQPVKAEVGAGLVDQAALSLLPDESTPILQHYYGTQGLAVRTSSTLTLSVDQQTQQIINTVKGGGGGGPEGGIFEVRTEFVTTPLWSPAVQTDANGDATVTVTLPDNLTTWRLDVRAVTVPGSNSSTTRVGQTTFDLLSTKPLLIRPVTPRFYVVGDSSVLAAVVNNNTDQSQDVSARIDAQGVTFTGNIAATQKGTIPARGRLRFEWPVEVQDVNNVGVTFYANTADNKYTDAAKSAVGQGDDKTLPVVRYEAPETVGTGGILTAADLDRTEGISLPRNQNITQGTLDIRVDPSLAASATDALNVLKNYPYQCLEQTISRFLPNLMTYRALQQLGIDDPKMKADLTTAISYAVQRVYSEQHVDGGWGWFVRDDSDALVSAYAIIGLSEAKRAGFDVDAGVLNAGIKFVQKNVRTLNAQADTWQLNRQSFLLYALTRAGSSGNYAYAVQLFQIREKLSIFARAYLAMTFHMFGANQNLYTDPLVSDLQNRAIASATGMHWEEDYQDWWNWNTDTRTTAIALETLVQLQPDNQLIPNVVRWLMIARKADSWETTQETAWAVMALTDWMQHTGELKPNYTFNVALNDKSLAADKPATTATVRQSLQLSVAVKDLLAGQLNKLAFTRTDGAGIMYYTAHLTAYLPVEQIQPLSRGFTLSRTYSQINDPDKKPITEAHVGDTIRVTLNIVVPNDLNYVVINDPIPAGAEAINPDLATSSQGVGKAPTLSLVDPLSNGWGWWWFDKTELRDDRTVMYASYLPQGTYQFTYAIRAGLAGQYHVIPATGQEFYFPEVYGRSAGSLFTLLP